MNAELQKEIYSNGLRYKLSNLDGRSDINLVDDKLFELILTKEDLIDIRFYGCHMCEAKDQLPKFCAKVNSIMDETLKNESDFLNQWGYFSSFYDLLYETNKDRFAKIWVGSANSDYFNIRSIANYIDEFVSNESKSDIIIGILDLCCKFYKGHRRYYPERFINKIFKDIGESKLSEACKIIYNCTPAISALLLTRANIEEKYIVKGLQSISKLTTQREALNIDLKNFECLGPRSRIKALKQIMGLMDCNVRYARKKIKNNPDRNFKGSYYETTILNSLEKQSKVFKVFPSREEMERFLFPCSMKYNEDVVEILKQFDEMVQLRNQQKE